MPTYRVADKPSTRPGHARETSRLSLGQLKDDSISAPRFRTHHTEVNLVLSYLRWRDIFSLW
jgi:hypothetical protein